MLILYASLKAVINLFIKFILSSKWTPWPISCEIWQRIHADYCGPFLGKFYASLLLTHTLAGLKSILPLIQLHNSHNKLSENCSVVKVFQWSW